MTAAAIKFDHSLDETHYFWAAVFALLAVSIPLRMGGVTPDISWLTDMCERMLAGEKAYVDIFETTPPVPTLLYMPGVLLANIFPVGAEAANYAIAYASSIAALILSARILPDRIEHAGPSRWVIIFPAAIFLFVLSTDAFAQREFYSAVFALPLVCVFLRHNQEGAWGARNNRFWAALLAGLSIAIKPPLFVLPGLLLALYYAFATRSVRFIYSSGLMAAGIIGVAVTVISLIAYPAYLDGVTQLMRDVYVPIKLPLRAGLIPAFLAPLGCLLFMIVAGGPLPKFNGVWIVGVVTVSYLLIYLIQGKYFGYHALPAAMFGLIGVTMVFWQRVAGILQSSQISVVGLIVYAVAAIWLTYSTIVGFDDKRPKMADLSWAERFDHPTAMSISPFIGVGFPLARQIDAQWIDRIHSQWVVNYTNIKMKRENTSEAEYALAERYFRSEINRTGEVLRQARPEILIQGLDPNFEWLFEEIIQSQPGVLDDYEVVTEQGLFRIWALKEEYRKTAN